MAIKSLSNGSSILIDDEDLEVVTEWSWHVAKLRPSLKPFAARIQKRYNRMYRLHLHREIAVRMRPDLIKRRFRVLAVNGDYLDCRRENLEVVLANPKGRGFPSREPRPAGWEREPVKRPRRDLSPASPLWTGGYVYRRIDHTRQPGGRKLFHLCIGRTPID